MSNHIINKFAAIRVTIIKGEGSRANATLFTRQSQATAAARLRCSTPSFSRKLIPLNQSPIWDGDFRTTLYPNRIAIRSLFRDDAEPI